MLVNLGGSANPALYRPTGKPDLTSGSWDPVPHADSPDGTFAVSNLTYSTTEGTNSAIYIESGDTNGFFRIESE